MAVDVQAEADKLGITKEQYMAFLEDPSVTSGSSTTTGGQGNQSWNTVNNPSDPNAAVREHVSQLRSEGLLGNTKDTSQQQSQQSSGPQTFPGGIDPNQSAVNTGAALLNQKSLYNPVPGKADPKTGIGKATGPTVSSDVPKLSDVGGVVATTPGPGLAKPGTAPTQTTGTQPTPQANAAMMSAGTPSATPPSFEAFQPTQQMAMLQTGSPTGHQTYKTAAGGTNTIVTR